MNQRNVGGLRGWWRRLTLREALVFTLPPMALALWLFFGALNDYARIRRYDDWWSRATSVRKFGYQRVRAAWNSLRMNELAKGFSAEREDVPRVRILVDRDEFASLERDVAARWGEWVDVELLDAGDRTKAKLRFRGDGSAHWTSEKKSLTLRTGQDELYKGFRSLAFSVKDVLPQWLVGTIAKDFGLLAPEQQIVPIYLNERFYGLHRFVEPVDEGFLRRNLRMPGNIFRADTAERGDYFKGLPREVFANPHIWDRVANNDRPGAFGTALLEEFLRDLNDSSDVGRERFMSWLDTEELSRLFAFLLVCGDPYHMSGVHNQFWYEDPTSGKLHPIVWDVRLLDLEKPPPGSNINRFWRAALEDPRVWDGAMREVAKWLEGDKLYKLAEQRVNEAWRKYEAEFEYESLRAGVIPPVGDPRTTLATLRKNLDTLRGWLSDVRVEQRVTRLDDHSFLVDLRVSGRGSAELESLELGLVPLQDTWHVHLLDECAGPQAPRRALVALETQSTRLEALGLVLTPRASIVDGALRPTPRDYRLRVELLDTWGSTDKLRFDLRWQRAGQGRALEVSELDSGDLFRPQPFTMPNVEVKRRVQTLVGEQRLRETLLIGADDQLELRPGARLILGPDASILAKGRVLAIGTAEEPITITSSDPNLPWGVFALQGEGANGSRFEHVKFERGGAAQLERVEYKGMVSVHNARDVVFDHCEFSRNQRCDDLINIVKADASITHSHFHHANADSIDYDMSSGLVAYNTIEGSGNDGLDLMTCWPRVVGNTILDSGDKGLSVGEDSRPIVLNNTIQRCNKGIEIKDRSEPWIVRTRIEGGPTGIHANKKNWRYGEAGWPVVVLSSIEGSKVTHLVEDQAKHTVARALLGGEERAADADLHWLDALLGCELGEAEPGPLDELELRQPAAALYEVRFAEDFVDPRDGWTHSPSVDRLVKRGRDLVATFKAAPGSIARAVEWDLSDSEREYALVLEAASESLEAAHVLASGPDASSAQENALAFSSTPDEYRFSVLSLPPGRYARVELAASPARVGKLRIHSLRVVAWPRAKQ